jgi:hypothetical protein
MSDYESLYVTLTEEEVARYAKEMAGLDESMRQKEAAAKRAAAQYKEEAKTDDMHQQGLAQRIRNRETPKSETKSSDAS